MSSLKKFSFIDIGGKTYECELNFDEYKELTPSDKFAKFTELLYSKCKRPIQAIVYEGTAINADNFDEYINV